MVQANNIFYINEDLRDLSDYVEFRNSIKFFVEQQLSNSFQNLSNKLNIDIVFNKSVNFINSSCIGFLLWLKENYDIEINITTLSKELYDLFEILGLTEIWKIQLKNEIFKSFNNPSSSKKIL